jgi:hypothetical protein
MGDNPTAKNGHDRIQATSAHTVASRGVNKEKTKATTKKVAPTTATLTSP